MLLRDGSRRLINSKTFRVNFKKNEKNYDATNSAVLRALKEVESDPKTPDEGKFILFSLMYDGNNFILNNS